jgi:hypothetical protein
LFDFYISKQNQVSKLNTIIKETYESKEMINKIISEKKQSLVSRIKRRQDLMRK